jgi:excisionase family DNA binding protein
MLAIGVVAERFGVSLETIRRWAKAGLLSEYRPDGNSRVFLSLEVEELAKKKPLTARAAAQHLGVSLVQLKQLEDAGIIKSAGKGLTTRIFTTTELTAAREGDH